MADALVILGKLFLGQDKVNCEDAADTNDDGTVQMTDAVQTLSFLFGGGKPPAGGPVGEPHEDVTPDQLGGYMPIALEGWELPDTTREDAEEPVILRREPTRSSLADGVGNSTVLKRNKTTVNGTDDTAESSSSIERTTTPGLSAGTTSETATAEETSAESTAGPITAERISPTLLKRKKTRSL